MLPGFEYVRVASLEEALRHLSTGGARVHAGGTDLLGCLRDGVFGAERVVSISALQDLRGIREAVNGGLRVGALTSIAELAAHPVVGSRYTALADAASQVASPQLRNQGTIGGNLCQKPRCWYYRGEFHCLRKGGGTCYAADGENQYHAVLGGYGCHIVHPSDTAPALGALDASVVISGPDGTRTVPLERFHVGPEEDIERETVLEPGEVVTEIVLPAPAAGLRSSYRKVRARRSWDFALAGVALALQFDVDRVAAARVFLSGAAPVPWRAREAEAALAGRPLSAGTARQAAAAAVAEAEPLSQNGYKIPLFQGLIEQQLLALAAG